MIPMIFQVDGVFKDFAENGEIATFRTSYPLEPTFWIRRSRTGEKEFEAELFKAVRVRKSDEKPFYTAQGEMPTGFSTTRKWIDKVKKMHDAEYLPGGWILYLERKY